MNRNFEAVKSTNNEIVMSRWTETIMAWGKNGSLGEPRLPFLSHYFRLHEGWRASCPTLGLWMNSARFLVTTAVALGFRMCVCLLFSLLSAWKLEAWFCSFDRYGSVTRGLSYQMHVIESDNGKLFFPTEGHLQRLFCQRSFHVRNLVFPLGYIYSKSKYFPWLELQIKWAMFIMIKHI